MAAGLRAPGAPADRPAGETAVEPAVAGRRLRGCTAARL